MNMSIIPEVTDKTMNTNEDETLDSLVSLNFDLNEAAAANVNEHQVKKVIEYFPFKKKRRKLLLNLLLQKLFK